MRTQQESCTFGQALRQMWGRQSPEWRSRREKGSHVTQPG